ncbi:hypothetical protein Ae717Ps2_6245c [Pseudonocardia sp. Ae717_Ps2]|uniref:hypothetical protein n=1 Tax=Pseudonocardia sp. Ae717_Ps2 TaxID=1885573 RepID=UPI0009696F01|nr:hypothetical protein [Pseudonocardia sp. Ae717_Ps2]OLM28649.1 hypothetical protein Ae717Ps2_6245c [Pseudonocardia sp. Ae717_Ps2]
MAATPRVLRIEFELRVPPGLRANIQAPRIEAAVLALQSAVQSVAGTVFPWADRIRVRWAWSYEWWAPQEPTVLALPATEKNTVVPAGDPATGETIDPDAPAAPGED